MSAGRPAIQSTSNIGCVAILTLMATLPSAGMDWSYPQPLNSNAATDAGRNDYYPNLATDGNGTWIAVWASRNLGGGPFGDDMDIFFARSTDHGTTWSDPTAIDPAAASDDLHDSSPVVYTDGSGHWLAAWESWDTGATSDIDLLYVVSTNGLDWSPPAPFNSDHATDPERDHDDAPHIAAEPDGPWVAVWQKGRDYGDEHDIYFSRSEDHGATWAPLAYLHASMVDDPGDDIVPRIASDGAGNLVVTWKTDNLVGSNGVADGDIHVSCSSDNGMSWSSPAALNTDASSDDLYDIEGTVATDRAGLWIAVWYRELSPGADRDLVFARSTDNGTTWTDPAPLNTNWATDAGDDAHPRLVTDGSGNWVVIWLSEDNLGIPLLGTDRDVLFARSCDDGAHWTSPWVLNGNAFSDLAESDWYQEIALGADGRLLAAWYTTDSLGGTIGNDRDILFATSTVFVCGDSSSDGDVDLDDFGGFQLCFAPSGPVAGGCEPFDFDRDDDVDAGDFAEFEDRLDGPS
jgi:hypothetical protein